MSKEKTKKLLFFTIIILIAWLPFLISAWDNAKPTDAQTWNTAASSIRDNWDALEVELGVDLAEAHPYYQSAAPTKKPDGTTALDVDDNGRIWIDSDDNAIYILTDYSVPTWTSAAASGNISSSDATFIIQNTDEEDSDGGRQSRWINKGEQSGGEATTLGYIEFSHDGTSDDQKGQFLIKVNDGDDGNSPSKQPIGYLATGKIDVSSSLSVLDEDTLTSDDDEAVATQQSIKAYADTKEAILVTQATAGIFGSWTNLDSASGTLANTEIYKVGSDGFVICYSAISPATELTIHTDGSNPPGTKRASIYGSGTDSINFGFCPVRKDDYFEVNNAATGKIYWLPIGTGTCVKQ